jgi:hypothetical protein
MDLFTPTGEGPMRRTVAARGVAVVVSVAVLLLATPREAFGQG